MQVDPNFKVLRAALSTLGRRLLAAAPGEERSLLSRFLLDGNGQIRKDVLAVLCEQAADRAALEK